MKLSINFMLTVTLLFIMLLITAVGCCVKPKVTTNFAGTYYISGVYKWNKNTITPVASVSDTAKIAIKPTTWKLTTTDDNKRYYLSPKGIIEVEVVDNKVTAISIANDSTSVSGTTYIVKN